MIYEISYKTLIGPKPLCIRFNILDGFIRIYDRSRYSVLLGPEKYDAIDNRIRYLISLKSDITFFSHYFAKVKVYSFSSLPIEKILILQSVLIFIKLVLNKYQNHYYYYKIFLEKYSYQLAKK